MELYVLGCILVAMIIVGLFGSNILTDFGESLLVWGMVGAFLMSVTVMVWYW